jgi:hydroxymethylbilane synthase
LKAPRLIIGTRGSRLALAQAQEVIGTLSKSIEADIELRIIKTRGDREGYAQIRSPEDAGLFVKELERALLAGEVDIAVHSLKDLPLAQPEGLEIAACTCRAPACDVLVTRGSLGLSDLPRGATVGTGSPRRRAQLLHVRGDLEVVPIRGNVDTRISLVDSGKLEAVVLAEAALHRLGLAERGVAIPLEVMLPAPGQGALALQVRADADSAKRWAGCCDHDATRTCVVAERSVLRELGGGCRAPLGALAETSGAGDLSLWVRLLSPEGKLEAEVKVAGDARNPVSLAKQAADEIKIQAPSSFPR